jgi:hypothetical protein
MTIGSDQIAQNLHAFRITSGPTCKTASTFVSTRFQRFTSETGVFPWVEMHRSTAAGLTKFRSLRFTYLTPHVASTSEHVRLGQFDDVIK